MLPMPELALSSSSLTGALVLAALVLAQVLVADVAGVRAKHVPGMPVTGGHGDFHFRAVRAHANTNESLPVLVLLMLLAVLLRADPRWTGYALWAFAAARAAHMVCYYLDLRTARSVAFGVGLFAQFVLLVIVALALR
jgi:uncharacterized MAPEG superfamily protein